MSSAASPVSRSFSAMTGVLRGSDFVNPFFGFAVVLPIEYMTHPIRNRMSRMGSSKSLERCFGKDPPWMITQGVSI